MDAYASKPFESEGLLAAIDEAIRRPRGAPRRTPPAAGGPAAEDEAPPWRREQALLRAGGDPATFSEIVQLFLADLELMLAEIRSAVERRDAQALERAAHRLRGSASFFDAGPVVETAGRLEAIGEAGDLEGADDQCRELEGRAERLRQALAAPMEDTA
jgi:HPt (histidine-containing phosphotransfer) domain-containing protein